MPSLFCADALMMTATWDWDGVEMLLDQAASLGLNGARNLHRKPVHTVAEVFCAGLGA